jgi:hypothetical protein
MIPEVAAALTGYVALIKQTVRKRGFGVLPAISIGVAALVAHSEPGDQV